MSGNHNASLERALRMVDIAAEAGADAVKLQTFKPETMTLNVKKEGFTVTAEKSLWKGRELFSLFKEAQTAWEWHKPIFERAKERGILCFSSAFDESSVDFLEEMGAPAYKIASFECTDVPLIRYVAQTGKPMIDPNYHGPAVFSYTVSDETGLTDTATVSGTVTSRPDAPVAQDDSYATDEDSSVSGNVIRDAAGQDTDIDGDRLAVVGVVTSGNPAGGAAGVGSDVGGSGGGIFRVRADGSFDFDRSQTISAIKMPGKNFLRRPRKL